MGQKHESPIFRRIFPVGLDVVPDGEPRFGFPNIADNAEIVELISCGAHAILFTTGRGSVVGSAISPVMRSDDLQAWQSKIIPAFEAGHPGIKVKFMPTAPKEYNAALNAKHSWPRTTQGDYFMRP